MTLDEAINILKSDIDYNKSIGCDTLYEEQLVEWLEELKAYRKVGTVEECRNTVLDILKAYNKGIDDFVKALQEKNEKVLSNPDLALECQICGIWKKYYIAEIVEQLKAGVENE